MKKGLSALFFALVVMAVFASNVLAAPAQSSRSVTLKSVGYERGGIVLIFRTSGLSKNDLKNISFTAHSNQYNVNCQFTNQSDNVRCVIAKRLSMFSGESFHGALAGFYFEGILPGARTFPHVATNNSVMTNTSVAANAITPVDRPVTSHMPVAIDSSVTTNNPVATDVVVAADAPAAVDRPATSDTPVATGTPVVTDTSVVIEKPIETPVVMETPTGCPAGQTLFYDFEWSGTNQSIGYLASSTTYYNSADFYAEYGSYYDYVSTVYDPEAGLYHYDYYIYNTYTFTSSGSIDASQWDSYVRQMQSQGYSVTQTGEHCE